jgi:hypothetical protein
MSDLELIGGIVCLIVFAVMFIAVSYFALCVACWLVELIWEIWERLH